MDDGFRHIAALRKAWQDVRASYWFVPGGMVAGAVAAAWIAHRADLALPAGMALPGPLERIEPAAARSLLSTIAGSVIGVAGVMFSLTLVAVTHAAGQYGPRLIGNFMRDRGNQWSLGILIATFVYALMALALLDGAAEEVARLSVALALAAALAAVGTVIFFVHHVPETVNVSNIAAGLGRRLALALDPDDERDGPTAGAPHALPDRAPDHRLRPLAAGYVQTVAFDRLEALAEEHDLVIRLDAPPGAFADPSRPHLSVWGPADAELRDALARTFALGAQPTEAQTPTFIADQLVEMTALALSPGVNDPFTAISCLNWLAAALAGTLDGGLPAPRGGRVHGGTLCFAALYRHTFPAARAYIAADPMAREAAIGLLRDLAGRATGRDRRAILVDLRALETHA